MTTPKHPTSLLTLLMLLPLLLLTACERSLTEGDEPDPTPTAEPGQALVALRIAPASTTTEAFPAAARTVRPVQDVCSRISIAFFQNGERTKILNQVRSEDDDFGSPTIALDKGQYQLVIVAHNGDGNATLTDPTQVKFPDSKTTDTFYYCDSLNVSDDATVQVMLQRAVAMFRLIVNDAVPADVATMKFYYTGGSSTLDATTGCGCVNSRQTELFTVAPEAHSSSSTYEVYTFPHADGKKLQMKVTAQSSTGTEVKTRTFPDIEVKRGQITQCKTDFFFEDAAAKENVTITVDDSWTTDTYEPQG